MSEIIKKVGILMTLKDEASPVAEKAGSNMQDLGTSAAQAGAKFLVITESLKQVGNMIKEFMGRAVEFDSSIQRSVIAMNIEGLSADDLKDSIKDLADETLNGIYTSQQAAEAFKAIADEGRGLENTLNIVTDAMNLAAATGDDLVTTTGNLEDIMSAWNMTAEDSTRIADVLLNTFRETGAPATEVSADLISMGQIMSELGIGFEEGAALIGVFKDVGISGVTGLLSAFTQLTNAESKASKELAALGVSALDAAGDLKSPTILFAELEQAGLSATQALELFGIRGSGAMVAAVNNIEIVGDVATSNLEATGSAAEAAGQYAESSAAETEKFAASMEDLKLELAEGVLPAFAGFLAILTPILKLLGEYPEIIYAVVGAFVAYKIATWAQTIAQAGGTAAVWANTVALLANPITWIVIAVFALILALALLWKNWGKVTEATGKFNEGAKKNLGDFFGWVKGGLGSLRKDIDKSKEATIEWLSAQAEKVGESWGKTKEFFTKGGQWLKDKTTETARDLVKKYTEMGMSMAKKVQGSFDALKSFFRGLGDKFKEWGKGMIKKWKEGVDEAKDKVKDAVGGVADKIKKGLGFSRPPEEGPLHEADKWGPHFVQMYGEGIISEIPSLERRLRTLSAAITVKPGPTGPVTTYAPTDARRNRMEVNQYFTAVDAEAIAGAVLEILAERMGV